jgi:hypothetical protein
MQKENLIEKETFFVANYVNGVFNDISDGKPGGKYLNFLIPT